MSKKAGDEFKVAAIVRENSPLLTKVALKSAGAKQGQQVRKAKLAVDELMSLWANGAEPQFLDVLEVISKTGLFEIPESLKPIVARDDFEKGLAELLDVEDFLAEGEQSSQLNAWDAFLKTPFKQIELYDTYVEGKAEFDTHQGVKGLEFPRVIVIIDDEEAKGFLFSFDKLFGAKEKSKTDIDHERAGEETTIDRTRRLFYVTCSRAEQSLAIIYYANDPVKVRDYVIAEGWFEKEEVVLT